MERPSPVPPISRERDEALKLIADLLHRHHDVAGALRKDRSVGIEQKFYIGFHFIEKGDPLGEELLEEVVKEGGRTKLGKIARNKLKLAQ